MNKGSEGQEMMTGWSCSYMQWSMTKSLGFNIILRVSLPQGNWGSGKMWCADRITSFNRPHFLQSDHVPAQLGNICSGALSTLGAIKTARMMGRLKADSTFNYLKIHYSIQMRGKERMKKGVEIILYKRKPANECRRNLRFWTLLSCNPSWIKQIKQKFSKNTKTIA